MKPLVLLLATFHIPSILGFVTRIHTQIKPKIEYRNFICNNVSSCKTRTTSTDTGDSPQTINEEKAFDLKEVDVRHGTKIKLVYDPNSERYIEQVSSASSQYTYPSIRANVKQKFTRIISNAFLPEGVTPSYYKFIKWRFIQRFINANVHVFGTQSLLMGLGIQNKNMRNALGLSAALNWVLKDALGKIVRMLWASKMG